MLTTQQDDDIMCDVDTSTGCSDGALNMKGASFMTQRYARFSSAISGINQYIQKIESDEMKKYNLRGSCAQYLVAILSSDEALTATRLSEICRKDKAAVSRAVAEMEEKNLLVRTGKGGNRYRSPLALTETGEVAAKAVASRASRAVELAGKGFPEEDRERFYEILELLSGNLKNISQKGLDNCPEEK